MGELESQADFSRSVIGSISLPSSMEEYPAGTDCTVSGWGTTSEGGSLGKTLMKGSHICPQISSVVQIPLAISASDSLLHSRSLEDRMGDNHHRRIPAV